MAAIFISVLPKLLKAAAGRNERNKDVEAERGVGGFLAGAILAGVRFLQFVFGIAVIGLYAQDLVRARNAGKYMDSKWMYATVLGTIASFSALVYMILPCCIGARIRSLHLPMFVYDTMLCICWLALFGIFGKMYISEDAEGNDGITRMKHAVWVDLINWLFWIASAGICGLRWFKSKKESATFVDKDEQPYGSAPV